MNKDIYLEQLYNQLKKYNTDSIMKHVTEYDYIITEMLEEESDFEQIIKKLGTPEELAASIAEEFEYEEKSGNQFEDPLISRNKNYKSSKASGVVITVINILFAILSVVYFFTVGATLLGLMLINMVVGFISIPGMIFFYIAMFTSFIFAIGLYMLILNLKRMLIMSLSKTGEVSTNE